MIEPEERKVQSRLKAMLPLSAVLVLGGGLLLGVVLVFMDFRHSSGYWQQEAPRTGGPTQLHDACSKTEECQKGQTCLTWSYEEKGMLGLTWVVQGGSCEFPCKADSDCSAPLQCLRNLHTRLSACR